MALKNYTSQVSASRSISHIEDVLVGHKSTQVLKVYSVDGQIQALAFIVPIDGVDVSFRLPARVKECERVLKAEVQRPRANTYKMIHQQAERTAWKIVSDWVDAQMAMIDLAQVELMEVFLPYVYNHVTERTLFDVIKTEGVQKLLTTTARVPRAVSSAMEEAER